MKIRNFLFEVVLVVLKCYRSNDYSDELVWAASWLYRATNDIRYLQDAEVFINLYNLMETSGFSWDAKISGADVSASVKQ